MEHPIAEHNGRFERLEKTLEGIHGKLQKGGERIAKLESSSSSIHKRMDEREREIKAVSELAHSVKYIADEMKGMKKTQEEQGKAILTLQRSPGDTAIKYWHVFVVSLITGFGGMAVTYFALVMRP
jgi:chromosome segregation ATPase